MEEVFEIENRGNHKMLYCRKRNLQIIVTERLDIPEHPADMRLIFGIIRKKNHLLLRFAKDIVLCFGVLQDDKIDYEPYFQNMLITNAVNYYVAQEWRVSLSEVSYSRGYQARFIDTMSLDPEKMTPELRGYMSRDPSEESLDFLEWKEKHLQPFLN
jgi:hypothetical protein